MALEHTNLRVLLIESDEVNIFVMEKILGKQFHLTVARNGIEALHFARRKTFDLVLTEIRLEQSMDGLEVMEELRKDSTYNSTEIWALTGAGLTEDETYFKELGFDRFFHKPVNHAELVNSILETLPERAHSSKG